MTYEEPLPIDFGGGKINWEVLRAQKLRLVEMATSIEKDVKNEIRGEGGKKDVEILDGIINLLDYIQDTAALALGELAVFGPLGEEAEEKIVNRPGRKRRKET